MLDDLLADWSARARIPFEGVRIVGSRWSPRSYETRDFLSRNQIPYQWIDVESDASMRELAVATIGDDLARLPLVLLPDGTALAMPSHAELAAKVRPADRAHASLLRPGRRSAPAPPAWRARSTARPKD